MGGKEFIGRVVSNRMQKTVVVAVSYVVWVPKYKVYQKRTSRHMAHDEHQECVVGDVVRIHVKPRYSKHKNYLMTQVIKRANVFEPGVAAQIAAARDATTTPSAIAWAAERIQEATSRQQAAESRYTLAQQQLAALQASMPQASHPLAHDAPERKAAPAGGSSRAEQEDSDGAFCSISSSTSGIAPRLDECLSGMRVPFSESPLAATLRRHGVRAMYKQELGLVGSIGGVSLPPPRGGL